ncbi:MAG: hypothetical protein ACOVOR_04565 [Rhabdochlamydiaceae bacterium]
MRFLISLLTLAATSYGVWEFSKSHPEIKSKIQSYLNMGHFHTLEVRYSAAQIMETHRKDLLKDARHKYLEPVLHFYPYVLCEVKYTLSNDKTKEGVILWDLTDGEMVINTKDWQKTHGFGDCINANTDKNEFRILNILSQKGGSIDREGLTSALHVEPEVLHSWLEKCRKKKLIVQYGNRYRLHLENPRLKTIPETKIDQKLVTKSLKNALCRSKRYSVNQVQKLTKAAFGQDFTIRKSTDVYLPVYGIVVQNPDGSVHTSHWNALNGKLLNSKYFIE